MQERSEAERRAMAYGHASMLLLGKGSEATEPHNKYDKIRPHSIRSLQLNQKVRPLSFRPENFDLFTATRLIQATGCKTIHNRDIPHQLFTQIPRNHGNTIPTQRMNMSTRGNIIMWGICVVCTLALTVAKTSSHYDRFAIFVPARSLLLFDLA